MLRVPCLPQNDNGTGGPFCNSDGGAGGDTTCSSNICVDTTSDTYNRDGCGNACKGTTPACCVSACSRRRDRGRGQGWIPAIT